MMHDKVVDIRSRRSRSPGIQTGRTTRRDYPRSWVWGGAGRVAAKSGGESVATESEPGYCTCRG